MIFLSLDNVKPGMILGKPIYIGSQPLLTENTILKANYLKRLFQIGVRGIYITNHLVDDIKINDLISQETKSLAVELAQKTLSFVDEPQAFTKALGQGIRKTVKKMIEEMLTNGELVLNLYNIKTFNGYIFEHSVNVCLYSLLTGIAMGYGMKKLEQLGIGAFLHDLGKMQIPLKILDKPGKLTEEEFNTIKEHSTHGYKILKKSQELDFVSAHIAYQHHEKLDGSGYPRGLQADHIHEFAKITAIADIFDAITSNRVYKKAMPNREAVEIITAYASKELDPDIVKTFLSHVPIYPVGTLVYLNNRCKGVVSGLNRDLPLRPLIRILEEGGEEVEPYEINLAKVLELAIVDVAD